MKGKLPDGWEVKKLGEIANTWGRIGWKGLTAKEYTSEGPLFLSVYALNYGDYVDFRDVFHISQARYDESPEIMLRKDDILICKDGAGIGKLGIVPELSEMATINSSLLLIRCKEDVISKYLYYNLLSPFFQRIVKSRLMGATTPHLYQRDIVTFPISLPSLIEQKRIVAILDEAFAAIATAKENAEKNLQNARELFESYLQSVFANQGDGWEEKKLGEVLQKTETINPTQNPEKEFIYIDVSSVNNKRFIIENTTLLKGINAPSRARKLVKKGDVIFATVRPTLRRIAIIPKEYDGQVCSTGYFVLRAKEHINNKLLFYFLLTNKFNEEMEKLQKGASYPAVTDNEVREQIIHYPKTLPEQRTIVSKLGALSAETKKLEDIYRQKLNDLEELKKSVLQKAFDGEL